MSKYCFLTFSFLLLFTPTFSQVVSSPSFRNDVSNKSISLEFDNDTYYYTDYYYTNGIEFELVLPVFNKSPFLPFFPKVTNHQKTLSGLSLSQKFYTPKNIRDTLIQFNDRPFAATLELNHFMLSLNTETGLNFSGRIRLGIIGPAAGGEAFQTKIHEWNKSPIPNGWDYQIANDIIINYDFFVNYPFIYKPTYKFGIIGGARVGTLNNDFGCGLNFSFGKDRFTKKLLTDEAIKSKKRKVRFFLNMDSYLKLVLFNATLQGGLFSQNQEYVVKQEEISPLVFSANFEIGVLWQGVSLNIEHNFLTKEFDSGDTHNYASIKLMYYF